MTTVSVLITSFEQPEMLREAVASALVQTRPLDQIVIADDGSADESPAVIGELTKAHPRLVDGVLRPVNTGIPDNRNAGLAAVTSEWVAVLDGDDLLRPGFVECLLAALDAQPDADAAYSNFTLLAVDGTERRSRYRSPQPCGDIHAHIASASFGVLRSMLVRTELLRRVGGFDATFPKHDGYITSLRLARLTQFVYVDESLVNKRDHAASDSKTFDTAARVDYLADVFAEVRREIADYSPAAQAEICATWEHRLEAVASRAT